MFNNLIVKYKGYLYLLFRLIAGALFFQHGAQKILGWFGGQSSVLFSSIWFFGLFEFIGGLAIFLGLFTRLAAFGAVILMLIAYFKVHMPQGIIPIINNGELALLYIAAFLILIAYGSKKNSLEKLIFKKEIF